MKQGASALHKVCSILLRGFFDRPAHLLARELLGTMLVRRYDDRDQRFLVTETEAYLGPQDLACHSARGRTPRTEILFGPPGTLYIYLVYGLHLMLNIVAGPQGAGAAVLIRSAGVVQGPGRLGRALSLSMRLNGKPADCATGLWFEKPAERPRRIVAMPRVGVDFAGPRWSGRKLRFILADRT